MLFLNNLFLRIKANTGSLQSLHSSECDSEISIFKWKNEVIRSLWCLIILAQK